MARTKNMTRRKPDKRQPGIKLVGADRGAKTTGQVKRARRAKPGTKALKEIRRYQESWKPLLPKAAVKRLCREYLHETGKTQIKCITPVAIAAMQEAAEVFLVDVPWRAIHMCHSQR